MTQALGAYWHILSNALLGLTLGAAVFAGLFAYIAGSPFVFIEHFGMTPGFSLFVAMIAAAVMASAFVNSRLTKRFELKTLILVGSSSVW